MPLHIVSPRWARKLGFQFLLRRRQNPLTSLATGHESQLYDADSGSGNSSMRMRSSAAKRHYEAFDSAIFLEK